jgi:hypothetical protein
VLRLHLSMMTKGHHTIYRFQYYLVSIFNAIQVKYYKIWSQYELHIVSPCYILYQTDLVDQGIQIAVAFPLSVRKFLLTRWYIKPWTPYVFPWIVNSKCDFDNFIYALDLIVSFGVSFTVIATTEIWLQLYKLIFSWAA